MGENREKPIEIRNVFGEFTVFMFRYWKLLPHALRRRRHHFSAIVVSLSLPLSLSVGCFAVHCCCTHANWVHRVWQRKLKRIGQTVCLLLAEILIFMKVVNGFCKHLWGRLVNWANIVSMRRPAHVFSSHSLDYYAVMSNKKRTIYDTVFFSSSSAPSPSARFPVADYWKSFIDALFVFPFFSVRKFSIDEQILWLKCAPDCEPCKGKRVCNKPLACVENENASGSSDER